MSTATWDQFYDEVLPYVRGCGVEMAKAKIIDAAIEFCAETFVWKADHAPIDAVADQHTYDFVPPVANTKVERIDRAWYDDKEILPKTEAELRELYANWPTEAGTPLYYLQEGLENVRLVPYPSASLTGALVMKVSLRPSTAATGVDTTIWERYVDDVAAGALAKLFVMPDKPWTNTAQAGYYGGMFEAAKDLARLKAFKGFTRARITHANRASRFR